MNNILIVDDKPDNLTVLLEMLTRNGYRVRPALSGKIALKAVQVNPPDLILLDIMMPGIDGFEVCNKLKSDARTRDIPIIFISALTETKNKVEAFQAGGVDYITKPFHPEEVLARVKTHLVLQEMRSELLHENKERQVAQKELQRVCDELDQRVSERTEELEKRTERLTEANIALNVLLEKREGDRKKLEGKVLSNIEKLVFPYLEKLKTKCDDEVQRSLLDIIQSNLSEITSTFTLSNKDYVSALTPTQLQIADLIKQGQTTKEIASLLNLSPFTIACHRQEIRKRLSLTNKKINLRTALSVSHNSYIA